MRRNANIKRKMNKKITEQDIIDALSKNLQAIDKDQRRKVQKPCRIKWNGKLIRTRSGKTVWSSIGAAKNALNLEFGYGINLLSGKYSKNLGVEACLSVMFCGDEYGNRDQREILYKEFIKKLIDRKILEFVEVDFESLSSIK